MNTLAPLSVNARRALRLVEFNLQPACFAHRSWYEESLSGLTSTHAIVDAQGCIAARAEPQLSRWLLEELDLQAEMDWEMEQPRKRLWLLDGTSLRRLARELALAMHREWLVQVIDAACLRDLQAKVGREALRFVVEEVPRGAFHYQSPAVSCAADSSPDLAMELENQGARTLFGLLEPAWRGVRGRAQLYFDRASELGSTPPLEPAYCERALELICGCLIPRRFPEWAWCF